MTDWPAEWRPVNPVEAQEYLDAHPDGDGDPETLEECRALMDGTRRSHRGVNPAAGTTQSPFPKLPEEPLEEAGAD